MPVSCVSSDPGSRARSAGARLALASLLSALLLLTAWAQPSHAAGLRWPAPTLISPTTVNVTNTNRSLLLDVAKDYIVKLPTDAPLTASGGLIVTGGRNVVLIGGEITIPHQGPTPPANSRRALYLKGQAGTVHVEGLLINGPDLNEGINLDQRLGATVQIQRVRIDATRPRDAADQAANHSDLIQTWAGPSQLRVDHFTGYTGYQGLFLAPTQYNTPAPTVPYELSNLDVIGLPGSGYMAWKSSNLTVNSSSVWLKATGTRSPSLTAWPSPSAWPGVSYGLQPNGEFVPAGSVGRGYQSSDGAVTSTTTTVAPMPTVTQATTTATSMPTTAPTAVLPPAPAAATAVTSNSATTPRSGAKKIRSRKHVAAKKSTAVSRAGRRSTAKTGRKSVLRRTVAVRKALARRSERSKRS